MSKRRQQRGRKLDGVFVLDKPQGISSNHALQRVKRIFGAAKAGHTGSLDPLATGVLPLCFGEATKFSQFLLDADKAYEVTARLGEKTASGDADSDVIEQRPVTDFSAHALEAMLPRFTGLIEQVPSMYSALKHEGQPLYKLARQGIEVERKPRQVRIDELTMLGVTDDSFSLRVRCSKGTYIRSLVEDIAEAMGNLAHVVALRRIQSGPYSEADAMSIEQLTEKLESGGHKAIDTLLLPLSSSVQHWPVVSLSETAAYYLASGQAVQVPGSPVSGWVSLQDQNHQFLGVGEILDDGRVAPRRLVQAS